MNKFLVTGANGLLGSHVVNALLKRKYSVRVLVRKHSNLQALEGLNVEKYFGEITNKSDIENAINSCNYAIHAAARTTQSPSNLESFLKPNVESVNLLLEACQRNRVKRLVFVSTANCFGNGSKEIPGTERTPFLPWLKKSGYAYSKYLAQNNVLKATKNGLDAVVVNPTFILGENDIKPSSGQIFSHILNKKIVFYPPGGKNFVDAEMAAMGVVNALERGRKGQCYLLAGENHSYKEFFEIVKKETRQRTLLVPIPGFILKFAGTIGSLIEQTTKLPVQLTITNAKLLCLGNYFSPQKAIDELDLQIIPSKKSVKKAISWFHKNQYFIR